MLRTYELFPYANDSNYRCQARYNKKVQIISLSQLLLGTDPNIFLSGNKWRKIFVRWCLHFSDKSILMDCFITYKNYIYAPFMKQKFPRKYFPANMNIILNLACILKDVASTGCCLTVTPQVSWFNRVASCIIHLPKNTCTNLKMEAPIVHRADLARVPLSPSLIYGRQKRKVINNLTKQSYIQQ